MQAGETVIPMSRAARLVKTRQNESIDRHFHTIQDLCNFVSAEIRASRMKFVKIAEKSGVCPATVSNLAHGETQMPRAATLLQILRALGYEIVVRG